MSKLQAVLLGLAVAAIVPAAAWSQGGWISDQYIERQKQTLDQNLQRRITEMENRFSEEQVFRVQQKDQRVAFERKLMSERKAFLDALKGMKVEARGDAMEAFYNRQRQKRKEFGEQRHAESRKFWDARMLARQQAPAPVAKR